MTNRITLPRRILAFALSAALMLTELCLIKPADTHAISPAEYAQSLIGSPAVEWGNGSGTQCPELPKYFIDMVYGCNSKNLALGNGNRLYSGVATTYPQLFEQIDYYDGFLPIPGDIISFESSPSPDCGHTAVVYAVDGTSYSFIEQWKGSGTIRSNTKTVQRAQYGVSYTIIGVARARGAAVEIPTDTELGIPFPRPAANSVIKNGSSGLNVKWLQYALNKLISAGLDVDGQFGTKTANAVLRFQRDSDLSDDGICGPATIKAIISALKGEAPDPDPNIPSVSIPYTEPATNQSIASHTAEGAKWVQYALNLAGGYGLDVDGKFGTATYNALVNFQSKYGLSADGICGPLSRQKLKEVISGKVVIAPVEQTVIPYAEPTTNQSVANHTAEGAKWVQYAMNLLCGSGLDVDGKFGNLTKNAVTAYQKSKGLSADGIVGVDTRKAINADIAAINGKKLSHITIESLPSKVEYIEGEAYTAAGLTVAAVMSDGSKRTLSSSEYTMSGFSSTAGNKTINVSYNGKTASFTVTVLRIAPVSITVANPPHKMAYSLGESFDATGLTINVKYNNGSDKTIDEGFDISSDMSAVGVRPINVFYDGCSTSFGVTVSEASINKIEITSDVIKKEYFIGDKPDYTGLVVTATYTDGKTVDITEDCTLGCDFSKAGPTNIYVSYGEWQSTIVVNVIAPTPQSILVTSLPKKTDYNVGDSLVSDGLEFKLIHNNGYVKEVSDYVVNAVFDAESDGTVTFTYEGVTGTFKVNLNKAAPELDVKLIKNEDSISLSWQEIPGAEIYYILINGDSVYETAKLSCNISSFELGKENLLRVAAFKGMQQLAITDNIPFLIEGEETTTEEIITTTEEPVECDVKLYAKEITAKSGETVEYPIYISGNPGLSATILNISYDTEKLTLAGVDNNGLFADASMTLGGEADAVPYNVVLSAPLMAVDGDGVVVTLRFTVKNTETDAIAAVTVDFEEGSTFDGDLNKIAMCVENSVIKVTVGKNPGDADNDGKLTLKDCAYIERFLAGGYDIKLNEVAADVDGDAKITLRDSVLIKRYLAGGYNVVIG